MEPIVALADYYELSTKDLKEIEKIIMEKQMSLITHGKSILHSEVTNIGKNGFWILHQDKEYFISFKNYPIFQKATVAEIYSMQVVSPGQLRWESLDCDIEIEALEKPEEYSLGYK